MGSRFEVTLINQFNFVLNFTLIDLNLNKKVVIERSHFSSTTAARDVLQHVVSALRFVQDHLAALAQPCLHRCAAAVRQHMAHGAMAGSDPLTDVATEAALTD